ncbi:unnamed protein product [Adineta ricciae]|uniref:Uncharacterized protein n=1 Tax=Adineta ricciae TaxID=249248 RepID=A0A814XBH6_ADIRI|nr:unnamed protein product [Adineta ricciae]
MKHRTIQDVAVLHTMLERCSESSNAKLKRDLETHQIPARLKKLAETLSAKHHHKWSEASSQKGSYTFLRCIQEESEWNSTLEKVGIMSAGIVAGPILLGIPTIVTGSIVYQMHSHANEVEEKLSWVVAEIESLYDQTTALITANLV